MRATAKVIAALTATLLLAAGCGSDTEGTATPTTTDIAAATEALWDPCSEIDEATLRKLTVDPASKRSGVMSVEEPGFKICSWNNDDFGISVFSTIHTVEDFRNKEDNIDFTDVTISGRDGVQFRTKSDEYDEKCNLVFPAEQGAFLITVFNHASSRKVEPPCDRLHDAAEVLVPLFAH